jgi:hypothetical protein
LAALRIGGRAIGVHERPPPATKSKPRP